MRAGITRCWREGAGTVYSSHKQARGLLVQWEVLQQVAFASRSLDYSRNALHLLLPSS